MPIEFQKKFLARPEGEIRVRRTDSTSSRISTDNAAHFFLEVYITSFSLHETHNPLHHQCKWSVAELTSE